MHKTLQTNRTGLCLRSLPSEQDRAQQKEANQKKCVGTCAEQGGSRRQKEPTERRGQGQRYHQSPPKVCTYLPVRQAPLVLLW